MIEKIKSISIVLLALIALTFAVLYYTKGVPSPDKFSSFPILNDSATSIVPDLVYTDTQGTEHFVVNDSKITTIIQNEKSATAAILEPIIDKLASQIGIDSKDIKSSTTISTETSANELKLQKELDSLKKTIYTYHDDYLSLAVKPGSDYDSSTYLGSNPTVDFSYNADLNITQYNKRNKFLGLPIGSLITYTDISSKDKRTTIKGVNTFTVKQKEPTYGLRLQGVGGYNLNSNSFFGGPSLRFDAGKTSVRFLYSYNTLTKSWSPTLAAEVNLISLGK